MPGLSPQSAPSRNTELRHNVFGAGPIAVAELIAESVKSMTHARRHLGLTVEPIFACGGVAVSVAAKPPERAVEPADPDCLLVL
jgi:hypothetical protein